ncbi:PHP domain-containing protein [Tessaracoccus aquimaris]|uniref:PHP domain-containing protein n=1 Tax=Tessaracoccus aquimaris TaxID=1332264 RepID=A0A1Q2CLE1_9ACTN|nr:PHP domain-containing protein [Tessaracoccus aquimaris]AQP46938.1 PHP domain-containing protein [Tessaracoccus aquimaris]
MSGLTPSAALREYAFWLERQLADTYRVRAFREAAAVADALTETPKNEAEWKALKGFGPKTAAIAAAAAEGRLHESLAKRRAEGAVSLDPAGDDLRALLRGDLHSHTIWSDGGSPLAEMADVAEALGHEYLAITDHSPRLKVARGLSRERLVAQWEEIDQVQQGRGMRILKGIEVDILAEGALDQADDLLDRLDIVTASVHSDLNADAATMTRRMVGAVSNPHTTVLGHPTGRKLRPDGSWRAQSSFDAELVFAACAMFGVAVEINSRPERKDPPLDLLLVAKEAGCLFSIDSDAHAPGQLDFLTYGAARAVEAGIDPERIITTWPLGRLLEHAKRRR